LKFRLLDIIRRRTLRLTSANELAYYAATREPFVTVGRHTYTVIPHVTVLCPTATCPVTVGSFCSIAAGVRIVAQAEHPANLPSTYPFRTMIFDGNDPEPTNRDAIGGPVTIGHDVWIGQNAVILSGVTIETGAIIGAGSIVATNVSAYEVVAGNPARRIRFRFDEGLIKRLLASQWWDLSDGKLKEIEPFLYSNDIPAFLDAAERLKR
jgi:acetyltransferase-like isoleucine patch superfamily enzyme